MQSSVTNSIVENNTINLNAANGIQLYISSSNQIVNNTINGNVADGVNLNTASNTNTVKNNIINSNTLNGIHISVNSDSNQIINNTANSNANGVKITQLTPLVKNLTKTIHEEIKGKRTAIHL